MTNRHLSWSDLTPGDRQLICSGCGTKGGPLDVPDFIFTADCNHHDFYYWRGGTAKDRLRADRGFLKAMLEDAYQIGCGLCGDEFPCPAPEDYPVYRYGFFRRNWYGLVALTYYLAVRAFASRNFRYGEMRTRKDLALLRAVNKDLEDRRRLAANLRLELPS